ncbi:MAG: hypothetical protein U9P10_12445 [Thermodesulfobacteriota bacterium]|nr:hypothetical protein [Thermodesulfobacteriota bacterium]
MLDISISYDKYKFLGNEFLTWLWYVIETHINISELIDNKTETIVFETGNSIVLENSLGDDSTEKISIKGDDAGLEEGATALKKGAVVTDINLVMKIDENKFQFTIKGESMNITGLKTPSAGKIDKNDNIEGALLEKAYLCSSVFQIIDQLFIVFIKKRISQDWKNSELVKIRNWVKL